MALIFLENKSGYCDEMITKNRIRFSEVCLSGTIKLTENLHLNYSPFNQSDVDCWVGLLEVGF